MGAMATAAPEPLTLATWPTPVEPAPRLSLAFGQRAREKFRRARMAPVARDQHGSRAFDGHANDIAFTVNSLDDARTTRIVAENLS